MKITRLSRIGTIVRNVVSVVKDRTREETRLSRNELDERNVRAVFVPSFSTERATARRIIVSGPRIDYGDGASGFFLSSRSNIAT